MWDWEQYEWTKYIDYFEDYNEVCVALVVGCDFVEQQRLW